MLSHEKSQKNVPVDVLVYMSGLVTFIKAKKPLVLFGSKLPLKRQTGPEDMA